MTAPIIVTKTITGQTGTPIPFLSLFKAIIAQGSPSITQYEVWQTLCDTGGSFVVDGVAQPTRTGITITAAQAATATFVPGTVPEVSLQIRAYNGDWSAPDPGDWSPFDLWLTDLDLPAAGLSIISVNLGYRVDNADDFLEISTATWINNLGYAFKISKIAGSFGSDFHPSGGTYSYDPNAEPIGQYNHGVQLWRGADKTKKVTLFTHSPQVFTRDTSAGVWDRERDFADPGIVVQPGDALFFSANSYNPYIAPPGFYAQENFAVYFEKVV